VAAIIANKIVPCTLELLDNAPSATSRTSPRPACRCDAAAILLIEVDGGHIAQVADDAEKVEEICKKHGAKRVQVAKDAAEKQQALGSPPRGPPRPGPRPSTTCSRTPRCRAARSRP
jgi:glycolate oxidase